MNSLGYLNSAMCFARPRLLVSILSVLCVLCGYSFAQEWRTVADGVEYAQVRREFSGKPVDINLLRLDLKKVRLDVHHAMDMAIGTETTSSIAMRHGAFAAINAGFFRLDTSIWAGDAAGVLMIDGTLLSESSGSRIALLIDNGTARTQVTFQHLRNAEPFVSAYKSKPLFVDGINRERKQDEVIMFTPEFGRTTLTNPGGREFVVKNGQVSAIVNSGSSSIPSDGYVISAHGPADVDIERNDLLPLGARIRSLKNKEVAGVEDITNGVPQLIKNGKIDITWEQEKTTKAFVETRHPRTAVAKLKDGKFLMLTADGRTEQSAGLDLYDLAAYMLELGAVDAMNLDGGGSTTMFLDGKVVNRVSDKEGERKVSDAILVTLRNKRKR